VKQETPLNDDPGGQDVQVLEPVMQDSHPEAQELQPPRIEPLPVCPAGQR